VTTTSTDGVIPGTGVNQIVPIAKGYIVGPQAAADDVVTAKLLTPSRIKEPLIPSSPVVPLRLPEPLIVAV
jgi:hypothetical protein